MTRLGLCLVIAMWLLPIALVIIRRRQLRKPQIIDYQPGMPIGLGYKIIQSHYDFSTGQLVIDKVQMLEPQPQWERDGCQWGCAECRGGELPCFCSCRHKEPA